MEDDSDDDVPDLTPEPKIRRKWILFDDGSRLEYPGPMFESDAHRLDFILSFMFGAKWEEGRPYEEDTVEGAVVLRPRSIPEGLSPDQNLGEIEDRMSQSVPHGDNRFQEENFSLQYRLFRQQDGVIGTTFSLNKISLNTIAK